MLARCWQWCVCVAGWQQCILGIGPLPDEGSPGAAGHAAVANQEPTSSLSQSQHSFISNITRPFIYLSILLIYLFIYLLINLFIYWCAFLYLILFILSCLWWRSQWQCFLLAFYFLLSTFKRLSRVFCLQSQDANCEKLKFWKTMWKFQNKIINEWLSSSGLGSCVAALQRNSMKPQVSSGMRTGSDLGQT